MASVGHIHLARSDQKFVYNAQIVGVDYLKMMDLIFLKTLTILVCFNFSRVYFKKASNLSTLGGNCKTRRAVLVPCSLQQTDIKAETSNKSINVLIKEIRNIANLLHRLKQKNSRQSQRLTGKLLCLLLHSTEQHCGQNSSHLNGIGS